MAKSACRVRLRGLPDKNWISPRSNVLAIKIVTLRCDRELTSWLPAPAAFSLELSPSRTLRPTAAAPEIRESMQGSPRHRLLPTSPVQFSLPRPHRNLPPPL